jgi:hypothetical protein
MKKKIWNVEKESLDAISKKASTRTDPPAPAAPAEKRKMFRFGEKAHKLAKRIAALDDTTIQDYIDALVSEDAKKRYPDLYKDLFPGD